MTGVVIKRLCEKCELIVDQWAFFKEDSEGRIILEKWLEHCPACKHPLKKPTDKELRNTLLINLQVAQNQSFLMQTQFGILLSVKELTQVVKDANQTQTALIKGLNCLDDMARSFHEDVEHLGDMAKSFGQSMDEHLKIIHVFKKESESRNKERERQHKEFKKQIELQTKAVRDGFAAFFKTMKALDKLVDEASKTSDG